MLQQQWTEICLLLKEKNCEELGNLKFTVVDFAYPRFALRDRVSPE